MKMTDFACKSEGEQTNSHGALPVLSPMRVFCADLT